MSNIVLELEEKISAVKTQTARQTNVGTVREIGDGIARVEGLSAVKLNEMIEFPGGIMGLALNLEETEVGVIVLGDYTQISEGSEAKTTGKLLSVPVGKGLLGRVVDALGRPIDGKGPIPHDTSYPVEKIAPGIIKRRPVSQPVQTGIMSVDAMIPSAAASANSSSATAPPVRRPSRSTRSSTRQKSTAPPRKVATRISAPSIPSMSASARKTPTSPASSRSLKPATP